MRLILCEKPSVAREVAKAIGQASQKDGYIQAGEYLITWAYGHLLEIDDKIAPQKWDLENLPILPERFSYRPKDSNSQKQIKVIKELLSKVSEVIINTDAGREGELIARLILSFCGWKGKTLRLWTSLALTPEVVRKELRNLKPSEEFDSLYFSALARQHSDWMVGINLTRAVSLRAGRGLWSVGRVQSPTLALIVQRDKEIESFKPEPYAVIKGIFDKGGQSYEGTLLFNKTELRDRPTEDEDDEDDTGFRLSPEKAQEILSELKKFTQGYITKAVRGKKGEYSPNLFSLTSLQRHMNKTYGWKAQKTLDIAQSLYEKGYISYPRTDSEHMAEENISLVKEVLRKLKREDLIESVDRAGKRVFDKTKLTDHHAIIPLKDGEVGGDEGLLFSEVKKRFFAVFYPPHEYELLKVFTQVGKYEFLSVGKRVIVQGWRELYGEVKDKELPELKEKDQVSVKDILMEKKLTKPPPHFTEAELLKLMEKLNLGTPATRAGIIETLKAREYIRVEKKSLISTQKGRELIAKLTGSKVIDVETTSEWEKRLDAIYKQRQDFRGYKEFLEGIKDWTKEEINKVKGMSFELKEEVIAKCPQCGSDIVEKAKGYFCKGCSFVLWKSFFGKSITRRQAQELLSGKSVLFKGLKSQKGNSFSAYGRLENGKIKLEFGGQKDGSSKGKRQEDRTKTSGKAFEKKENGGAYKQRGRPAETKRQKG